MSDQIKVLACPFCGHDDVEIDEVDMGCFAVCCPECECIGPVSRISIEEAVGLWNVPARRLTDYRELLCELLVQLCENPTTRGDGNAPGHAHQVPGVWDADNGDMANQPCAWCAAWAKAVATGLVDNA